MSHFLGVQESFLAQDTWMSHAKHVDSTLEPEMQAVFVIAFMCVWHLMCVV